MSSDEKRYPASELKLQRLRDQGIVPLSGDCLTFAAFLGVLLGITLLLRFYGGALTAAALEVFRNSPAPESLRPMLGVFIFCLLAGILPLLGVVLFIGALQTRFLISFSRLSPDFSRLFRWPAWSLRAGASIGSLALRAFVWIVVSIVVLRYACEELPQLFLKEAPPLAQVYGSSGIAAGGTAAAAEPFRAGMFLLQRALQRVLAVSFFVGALSYLFAWFAFRREHMMTRAEVEAEGREQEPAPLFAQRRREIQSEQTSPDETQ